MSLRRMLLCALTVSLGMPPAAASPAAASPAAASPAGGAAAFAVSYVALCQPNGVLLQRIGSPAPLAAYISKVEASVAAVINAAPAQAGFDGAIVVALKPGLASRAWIVVPDGAVSADLFARLEAAADSVTAIPLRNGPVAFALVFAAFGAPAVTSGAFPEPAAWAAGAPPGDVLPDGPLARIWP